MDRIISVGGNVVMYAVLFWQLYESVIVRWDPWLAFVVAFVLVLTVVIWLIPGLRVPEGMFYKYQRGCSTAMTNDQIDAAENGRDNLLHDPVFEREAQSKSESDGNHSSPQGLCADGDRDLDASISRAAERIRSLRRVIVTSHRDPDGDALGASVGLGLALRAGGYEVEVVNADPPIEPTTHADAIPSERSGLAAIPGAELVIPWERMDDRPYDCAVLVDCSTLDRLHSDPEIPRRILERTRFLLVIDHHLAPSRHSGGELRSVAGDIMRIVDPGRASSAELVALFIEAAGLPMERAAATALLTGIATDTKGFLRERTDARALARASQLRALGGDLSIAEDILQRHSADFLILAGRVLRTAVFIEDGAGIVASIPRNAIGDGIRDGELERLTMLLSGTREACAIVLLQAQADEIRGSVRTRAPVDAVSIARLFGGGGHERRSGFRVRHATLEDLVDRVSAAVRDAVTPVKMQLANLTPDRR